MESQTMKTTVVYHSADYDGIFCREIARKFLPDAELIGWNFCDNKIQMELDTQYYVLDLPPECLDANIVGSNRLNQIIWIDHHKTSIEKWPASIPGYRIDGVAACRLAWQYFTLAPCGMPTPTKDDYIQRRVFEPYAVQLAGEYDIWDKRNPDTDTFQYGLRTADLDVCWELLLGTDALNKKVAEEIVASGRLSQRYAVQENESLVRSRSFIIEWNDLKFLSINTARCNSLTFSAKDIPETGHDALLGFYHNGKCWTVSLYHARHRTDLDLSEIAKKHGGGGHRGACGFTCNQLPWPMA